MAQERFWNYRDDDLTFRLDQWLLGVIDAGLYRGFDPKLNGTLTLRLEHDVTGYVKTLKNGDLTNQLGVYVTKQGVLINEDAAIEVDIPPTGANARIDYVVAEHDYIDVDGGTEASYKVIQGPANGSLPTLTNPNVQIILGQLSLPPNTTSLLQTGVVYTKTQSPEYGGSQGRYVDRKNGVLESDLNAQNNKVTNLKNGVAPGDAINRSQLEQTAQTIIASIVQASTEVQGKIELATQSETITGSDNERAITPATLQGKRASQSRLGILRFATAIEMIDATATDLGVSPFTLLAYLVENNYVTDADYNHTDNNFTDQLKARLESLVDNVQGDWNESNSNDPSYIRNKPLIPTDTTFSTFSKTLSLWREGTRLDTTTIPYPSMNEDIVAQAFVTGPNGGSFDVEAGNIAFATSFSHNIASVSSNAAGSETRFRLNFRNNVPDSFYSVSVEVHDVNDTTFDGVANSTITYAVNATRRNYVDISLNEWRGIFQRAGILVTCRRLKFYQD